MAIMLFVVIDFVISQKPICDVLQNTNSITKKVYISMALREFYVGIFTCLRKWSSAIGICPSVCLSFYVLLYTVKLLLNAGSQIDASSSRPDSQNT